MMFVAGANAEVIKPINTIEDARGIVVVADVEFDYRVTDRGWRTFGSFENGRGLIVAEKSFVLSYSGRSGQQAQGIESALTQDGASKCQELGEIEYAEQIKSIPDYQTSLKAEVVNGRAEGASNGLSPWATFVCLVTVEAKK